MKAAVFAPPTERLSVEDVSYPPPGPYDVRVRIDASGVCGSDLGRIRASLRATKTESVPPMVLGHEAAGTVLEIGERVTRVSLGDRVISAFTSSCGQCWYCARDETFLCERSEIVRQRTCFRSDGTQLLVQAGLGTYAEEMVVHQDALVAVHSELPAEQLALVGCSVTTGVGAALFTADVQAGSTVAVIGCGGVGQFVIQGARIAGATRIFAVDTTTLKLEAARAQGATDTVDASTEDVLERLRDSTGGRGVDYAFEAAGAPATTQLAFDAARRGGTVVAVGRPPPGTKLSLDAEGLHRSAKRVIGSFYGSARIRRDFPRLIELAEAGMLDLGAAVSRRFALGEVNSALDELAAGAVLRAVICS